MPGLPHTSTRASSLRVKARSSLLPYKEAAELPDEEYPFTLTTGRLMFHFHTGTMTRRSGKLVSEVPEAYVEIHPDDAKVDRLEWQGTG
jgi:predicted molibdopterin-dependent oxidoreductase YjgC